MKRGDHDCDDPPPAGVLAAAVLRAARHSASASVDVLAEAFGLSVDTYLSLESGTCPLAEVPIDVLDDLKLALENAGANAELTADLDAAAWGDLVLGAVATNDEVSLVCLLADPLVCDSTFAELMAWALAGWPPSRYRPYVTPVPLVRDTALAQRSIDALQTIRYDAGIAAPLSLPRAS
jgi:hypothetical protein